MDKSPNQLSLSKIESIENIREKLEALLAYTNRRFKEFNDGVDFSRREKVDVLRVYSQILGIDVSRYGITIKLMEETFESVGMDLEKDFDLVNKSRGLIRLIISLVDS